MDQLMFVLLCERVYHNGPTSYHRSMAVDLSPEALEEYIKILSGCDDAMSAFALAVIRELERARAQAAFSHSMKVAARAERDEAIEMIPSSRDGLSGAQRFYSRNDPLLAAEMRKGNRRRA